MKGQVISDFEGGANKDFIFQAYPNKKGMLQGSIRLPKDDYLNENIVKVITNYKITNNLSIKALNFSRIIKEENKLNIYHHFGIYSYKLLALKQFVNLKKSENEIKKKLEQLRAIENSVDIDVVLANNFSIGIDTKKDLDEYIKILNK